jgi:hypothetical protein
MDTLVSNGHKIVNSKQHVRTAQHWFMNPQKSIKTEENKSPDLYFLFSANSKEYEMMIKILYSLSCLYPDLAKSFYG